MEPDAKVPVTQLPNEETTWFSWQAPERAFKRRDREFWATTIAMLALVSVILFFANEFFLILALFSALFMAYVLSTVPPKIITNKLTTHGIYFDTSFYPWTDLTHFWFGKSLDNQAVYFETQLNFPRQVSLIFDPQDMEVIKKHILNRLPLLESSPRFIDKATSWASKKIPLETKEKSAKI